MGTKRRKFLVRPGVNQRMCCLFFTPVYTTSQTITRQGFGRFNLQTAAANLIATAPPCTPDAEFAVMVWGPTGGPFTLTVVGALGTEKFVQPDSSTATSYVLNTDGEVAYFKGDGVSWGLVG